MSKHKSEDYKIIAVKYYLENNTNYTKTCDIFKFSERSLKRWIERYKELEKNNNIILILPLISFFHTFFIKS
jgi:transposase